MKLFSQKSATAPSGPAGSLPPSAFAKKTPAAYPMDAATGALSDAAEAEQPHARLHTAAQAPSAHRLNLVISVHDVSPLTQPQVQRILEELRELGVARVSLLVIPNHHRMSYILDEFDFCEWLRAREAGGDEVVIHGYCHRRDPRVGESVRQKLTTRHYTAGEGEFYDIPGADALRIVSQARQDFRRLNIEPKGFIAPAWLLSNGAERALVRLGLSYTTRLGGLYDYTTGVFHRSQSLTWSTRSFWRRVGSFFWNAQLFGRVKSRPLLRLAIHPNDIEYRFVWRQIRRLIRKALRNHASTTYSGYLKLE